MSTEVGSLHATIRVETQQAERGLRKFRDDMAGTARATQSSIRGIDSLASGLRGLAAAYGISQAAQMIVRIDELGTRARRAQSALSAYSGGLAQAAANTEAMKRATDGALSSLDAQQQASRLLSMGLASNAQELEKVTRIATVLGTAMGRDVNQSIEEFSLLMANQSLLRLDSFGISSARVRQRMDELQASVKGMTREQAFNQAVLEIGAQKLDQLEKAGYQASSGMEQLRAGVNDLAVSFANSLAPSIDESASSLGKWIQGVAEANNQVQQQGKEREQFRQNVEETAQLLEAMGRTDDAAAIRAAANTGVWRGNYRARVEGAIEAANAEAIYNQQIELSRQRVSAANPELISHANYIRDAGIAADNSRSITDLYNDAIEQVGSSALRSAEGIHDMELAVRAMGNEADEANKKLVGLLVLQQQIAAWHPEFFSDPQFANPTPTEARAAGNIRLVGAGTNQAGDADRVLAESARDELMSWWNDYQNEIRETERVSKKAANESEKEWKKSLREMERAAEERFNTIRSAVQSSLNLNETARPEDFLLDQFGLRQAGPGEIIRRLQAVANEGREGGGKQWADFYASLLGIDDTTINDEVKARAIKKIQDIQMGLIPEAIDKDALKLRALAKLRGDRNLKEIVDEVAREIEASGEFTASEVNASIKAQFGVEAGSAAPGATMVKSTIDSTRQAIEAQAQEIEAQGRNYGAIFRKGLLDEVASAGGQLIDLITQRVMDRMLSVTS